MAQFLTVHMRQRTDAPNAAPSNDRDPCDEFRIG
jgi:hypothetical protein